MCDNINIEAIYLTLLLLPIVISNGAEIPVIYRMTQYDSMGKSFGSRVSNLNLEIKSLESWTTGRHCVLTKLEDLTIRSYTNILQSAGGLIVQLPEHFSNLSKETKNGIYEIERLMLNSSANIPVYFSPYTTYLKSIIDDISNLKVQGKSSGFKDFIDLISSNGYQAISSKTSHTPDSNSKLTIIKGELTSRQKAVGSVHSTKAPVIVITSNITPFRLTNHVSFNPDAALMMLIMDTLSKLYNSKHTSPAFKIVFLSLESGPLLNFQGTKKILEDNQMQDVDFVLCLDTIIQPTILEDKNNIYMHVSKPPKEGSVTNKFYKLLKETGQSYNVTVEGIHKKINLAEPQMAWEHERFGMKKITSFTLSNLKNFKSVARSTIFIDDNDLMNTFYTNYEIIIETLFKYIFDINDRSIVSKISEINKKSIKTWSKIKSTLQTNDVKNAFEKYLENVKVIFDKPDYRDPDFMFYNGPEAQLNIYYVKAAVFDLFLTFFIALYLLVFYFALNYFSNFYKILRMAIVFAM